MFKQHLCSILLFLVVDMMLGILACCTVLEALPSHSLFIQSNFLCACTVSPIRNCQSDAHDRGSTSWCCCLGNQLRCRQKRSHGAAAKESKSEPTARQTGQHALASPQHHSLQPQQAGSCQGEEECFMQALREVIEHCMHSEQLPQLSKLPQVCCLEQSSRAIAISHDTNVCMSLLQWVGTSWRCSRTKFLLPFY